MRAMQRFWSKCMVDARALVCLYTGISQLSSFRGHGLPGLGVSPDRNV